MSTAATRRCLWCGAALDHTNEGMFCNNTHQVKQYRHRRRYRDAPLSRCPHPFKLAFTHRGQVIVAAEEYQQFWYFCRCGVFHLTSHPQQNQPVRSVLTAGEPSEAPAAG